MDDHLPKLAPLSPNLHLERQLGSHAHSGVIAMEMQSISLMKMPRPVSSHLSNLDKHSFNAAPESLYILFTLSELGLFDKCSQG